MSWFNQYYSMSFSCPVPRRFQWCRCHFRAIPNSATGDVQKNTKSNFVSAFSVSCRFFQKNSQHDRTAGAGSRVTKFCDNRFDPPAEDYRIESGFFSRKDRRWWNSGLKNISSIRPSARFQWEFENSPILRTTFRPNSWFLRNFLHTGR